MIGVLWKWIQVPVNQGIVAAIATIIGIVISIITYLYPHEPKPTITSEFVVCSGEYEGSCPAHNVYVYCYVDPEPEAAKACKKHSFKTSQSKGGNKCGYTWTTYLCTNDAP
jgi:hypothetical protein